MIEESGAGMKVLMMDKETVRTKNEAFLCQIRTAFVFPLLLHYNADNSCEYGILPV